MVVGGSRKDDTQLVDLTSGTKSCRNWQKYPIALETAAGSIISNKSIIVCGGLSGTYKELEYLNEII